MVEDSSKHTSLETLGLQMAYLRQDVEQQAKVLHEISVSLRALTAVEIHQEQILNALVKGEHRVNDLDTRVNTIEHQLPSLVETRRWVVGGVIAVVCMMGASIVQLTVLGPAAGYQRILEKHLPELSKP